MVVLLPFIVNFGQIECMYMHVFSGGGSIEVDDQLINAHQNENRLCTLNVGS